MTESQGRGKVEEEEEEEEEEEDRRMTGSEKRKLCLWEQLIRLEVGLTRNCQTRYCQTINMMALDMASCIL